ncbi:hypothetical protein A3C87_02415 [Candidatus Kaiserbacteria bacterium RIFCSPHIGHO2_02_FULL_49_34]|uniref:Uncharacterized protein n=1 Tax=Candidatus Kaiserbacteria bacterium RIFCSPHIGHO2_02_FULL_49_34 TaxID=1798491 RepID=A0A1F6DLX1_9BACT|nr:MAG: hypothetical protein A3C87_02415 [Candidatus Kaiserbacteria bacterium RIFCSPHIGHO2_02_FULL_49_34]
MCVAPFSTARSEVHMKIILVGSIAVVVWGALWLLASLAMAILSFPFSLFAIQADWLERVDALMMLIMLMSTYQWLAYTARQQKQQHVFDTLKSGIAVLLPLFVGEILNSYEISEGRSLGIYCSIAVYLLLRGKIWNFRSLV